MEYFNGISIASLYYDIYNYLEKTNYTNMIKRYANAQFLKEYAQFLKEYVRFNLYIDTQFRHSTYYIVLDGYQYLHNYSNPNVYVCPNHETNINGIIYKETWYKFGNICKSIEYIVNKRIIKEYRNGIFVNEKIDYITN